MIKEPDLTRELSHLASSRQYPIGGWTYDGRPVMLRDLADRWAENPDGQSLEAWLDDRLRNGRVTAPSGDMVDYKLGVHTVMYETRLIHAPAGMTMREALEWVERNGDGDLIDIDNEENTILTITGPDDQPLDPDQTYTAIPRTGETDDRTERLAEIIYQTVNMSDWRMADDTTRAHWREIARIVLAEFEQTK
ncbi:hypothetical protein [Bifidobacterium sp. SO1]|uniref:hypothetical protein n=1 Tax=Bifidobacterium sp. SO1 TaxID=2809029 RepID=UPI001BDC29C6|nr:hypothetical protein [Bifidobacterium sp. SO1]MBT1161760.1 hypothetical protein [Bifidobacterium sp. SO1]